MKITRVKKRDGRTVPFEKSKIQGAVARAQAAAGVDDPGAAVDVADLVELALVRRYFGEGRPMSAKAIPGIEEIQDLVEQALVELGHAAVAKVYILYRDRRARIRDAAHEPTAAPEGDARARIARGPRVQVSGGLETWKKGRIVAALMDEADLPRARAEEVAARVEERVFALGVKRLSTALIRELVDNELVELGLSNALKKHRPVGLPRHDLRALLAERRPVHDGGAASAAGVGERVGGEILRRYALEDVLDDACAERHLSGEFHVVDLDRLHLAHSSAIPCDAILRGAPSARAAFDLLDDLADAARGTAHGVVLEDAGALLAALARNTRGGGLSAFLCALSALARGSDRRVDLSVGAVATSVLAATLEEIASLEDEGRTQATPHVYVDARDLARIRELVSPAASRALETLLARGRVIPTWSSERARRVGPSLVRGSRERGALHCGGVVALNLPRAARRAGPWRDDALFENLAVGLEHALDALARLRDFQRDGGARAFARRGRVSYAVTPVGLREALRWLLDGEIRPDHATRLVAFLAEAAARFGAARGLDVVVTPALGGCAAARFSDLDAALFPLAQPLLFEGVEPRARDARGSPYATGFDLAASEPGAASTTLLAAHAALAQGLETGLWQPVSLLRAAAVAESPYPCTEALERLERARSRPRPGVHALYVLPRPEPEALDFDESGVLTHASAALNLYTGVDSDDSPATTPTAPRAQ